MSLAVETTLLEEAILKPLTHSFYNHMFNCEYVNDIIWYKLKNETLKVHYYQYKFSGCHVPEKKKNGRMIPYLYRAPIYFAMVQSSRSVSFPNHCILLSSPTKYFKIPF